MNVLLLDADSTIPNLALMKLSSYHKNKGDKVELRRLNIPYSPHRKKQIFFIDTHEYDKTYCSIIFDTNKDLVVGNDIIFGGTGFSIDISLPEEIEACEPDYSIYPENDTSYGFMTRGCIRNCYFCKVPSKEGGIRLVSEPEDIIRHKRVKFLDNNIFAYKDHKRLLSKLLEINVLVQFNQGLDIRLLDEENSSLLGKLRWIQNRCFAFDDIKYKNLIGKKLELMPWRKDFRTTFFVYVHPNMPLSDTVRRIVWLKEQKCLPYVMRDISCYDSPYSKFYTALANWCNFPPAFIRMEFDQYLEIKHPNRQKVSDYYKLYRDNM